MRLLIAATLSLASTLCLAQEEVGTIAGAGWVPCAEFAQRYQQSPQVTEEYFYAWAQGYMSGVNQASLFGRKNVRGLRIEQQKQHIRSYCDEHPLANVVAAVHDLYEKLPNR